MEMLIESHKTGKSKKILPITSTEENRWRNLQQEEHEVSSPAFQVPI